MLKTYSILRKAEYAWLADVPIAGAVLDLGGGNKADYIDLWSNVGEYVSVNIDEAMEPSVIMSVEDSLPLPTNHFSYVIALNLLEHVYQPLKVVDNAYKHTAPGGWFVGAVPFMHQIHGSPHDFYRYTESALTRMLTEAGFVQVSVAPVGLGLCSLLYQFFGSKLPFPSATMRISLALDSLLLNFSAVRKLALRIPQGYGFKALKQ